MFLIANLALMGMSPDITAPTHVTNVDQEPILTLRRPFATIVLLELSLPVVTTVLFAPQDLLPRMKALLPVIDALLVATNLLDILVTTALQALSLQSKEQVALLHAKLVQLELFPETLELPLVPNVLLAAMLSTELAVIIVLLVLSLLKELEISTTVLPALPEALPRVWDHTTAPSVRLVTTNSTEPPAMPAPWVLSLLKPLLVLANAKPALLVP